MIIVHFTVLDIDMPDIPAQLEGFGLAQAFDRYIYICGGFDLQSPKVPTECQSCCKKSIKIILIQVTKFLSPS
jgi:hypothetical protein